MTDKRIKKLEIKKYQDLWNKIHDLSKADHSQLFRIKFETDKYASYENYFPQFNIENVEKKMNARADLFINIYKKALMYIRKSKTSGLLKSLLTHANHNTPKLKVKP